MRFLAVTKKDDIEWIDRLMTPLGDRFLSFGNGRATIQNGIPSSYLLMAFADINNEKARDFIAKKKEWLLALLRREQIRGKLSNGKISEKGSYNLMEKYILRNAIGILPEYEEVTGNMIVKNNFM